MFLKQILKNRKHLIELIVFFSFFTIIYFILDYLNMSYKEMRIEHGFYLVIINIILNLVMAFLSSILIVLNDMLLSNRKQIVKGSSLGFFAIIFGVFTYGCTPCVIAFLANFGIMFSVVALPFAGLPYKFISLFLIVIGLVISNIVLKRPCEIKSNLEN